ncbi:aspartic peptidase domain-containing protein, partial [Immersiella caudata]
MVVNADVEGTKTKSHHHTSTTPTPVTVNVTGMFKDVAYGVKVWIGSPEQSVVLDFDTGSSETWVNPPCTGWEGLDEYESLCRQLGTYVPQQSDTSIDANATCPPRWITYGSGAAEVRYYKDVVNFVDPWDYTSMGTNFKLHKPVQFGVATWSQNMVSGIMGAGYGRGYNQKYSGFIDEIYDQGLVQDKDFAIALGSVNEGEGELVFGGIDLSKFMGPLNELSLADQYSDAEDGFFRYWINVTSIGVTPPGSCVTTPVTNSTWTERFLPDTGTTLTYMPEEAFYAILDYFPDARPEPGFGYSISCAHKEAQGTIDFGFNGFTIHVPYSEFIFEIPAAYSDNGQNMCVLGAIPASYFYILGDTFLRAAYAVFRQQEHKVYLGQFINCGEDIVSSHGDVSQLYGNCGHRRPYAPPSDSTSIIQPYGAPPSPSNATTSAKPSATPIGFGTCRSYSTGTYSALDFGSSTTEVTFTITDASTTWTTAVTEVIDPGASVTTMRGLAGGESYSFTDSYSTDSYSYTDSYTTESYSYTDSYSSTDSHSYTDSYSYTDGGPTSSSFDWSS